MVGGVRRAGRAEHEGDGLRGAAQHHPPFFVETAW